MSARPALSLSLRQTLTQSVHKVHPTRNLHTLRPHRRPHLNQRPAQCLHLHRRNAGTFASNARTLFRKNPVTSTLAAMTILVGAFALVYANHLYAYYILKAFHNYPEPVAKKLRKALYYTNTDFNPVEALKFYKQALQVADELGMDPFSDEITGIKIQVAKLCEEANQPGKAIQVLEILRGDCLEWIKQFGGLEHNRKKKTKVLARCVGMSVKLGELYGMPEIYDREMAEERLVWAVETVLKEAQRRENIKNVSSPPMTEEQLDEVEGPWMSPAETGAALEALAHNYEEKDQHYLATPLFLQALSLHPTKNCHTVVIMNNLASSLAQQSPRAARAAQAYASSNTLSTSSSAPTGPTATRESMIASAQTWAKKALDVAAGIAPPDRDEECDVGCAVATHNLGEFAEMAENVGEARERYKEAVSLARAVGFQEGVEQSSARLRALRTM